MSCRTCQPTPDCSDTFDRYSLQEDVFFFVGNCPPGYSCDNSGPITLICCTGQQFTTTVPEGATAQVRNQIISAMVTACARETMFCGDGGSTGGTGGGGSPQDPLQLFYSVVQSATVFCPNGTGFVYTTQAGRFLAFDQDTANQAAYNFALAQANSNYCCLSALPGDICLESAANIKVSLTGPGATPAILWAVSSGTLPPGLALQDGWRTGRWTFITGTPTTPGSYTFTIRATNANHFTMQRTYTVCVVGITTATALPDASLNQAYSETLSASSCATPPLSYQVTSGALPAGLLLNEETGEISGTPTVSGDFAFTITLQTSAT